MAHGSSALLWSGPSPTEDGKMDFTNPQLRQRFSRVERVTGIEPALSAWELFELMGFVLSSVRVSWSRAAWSVPWMPAVMARQWHGAGDSSRLGVYTLWPCRRPMGISVPKLRLTQVAVRVRRVCRLRNRGSCLTSAQPQAGS